MGICKNFEYKLRSDGGYDCTTELIARGEVLEGLKFNVIPIKFSNSYFLKGGIHCCTLDTIRKSKY